MTTCNLARILMRFSITLLFAVTFVLAGFGKLLDASAPDWFVQQFAETPLGALPPAANAGLGHAPLVPTRALASRQACAPLLGMP